MSEDNGMKQYLAVEKIEDANGNIGTYELVFSAPSARQAEGYMEEYGAWINYMVRFCGELTDTYIVR